MNKRNTPPEMPALGPPSSWGVSRRPPMKIHLKSMIVLLALGSVTYALWGAGRSPAESSERQEPPVSPDRSVDENAGAMLREGRRIFRFDTFGDEAFWGDTLRLHSAIAGEKLGGVGPGVSPRTALAVGLKVDAQALPPSLVEQLKRGQVDLDSPATTLALLKLHAVVGVTGFLDPRGRIVSLGIQCAFCHSTVDDSLAPGIGRRLDGWANRDLNVGAIVGLSPNLKPVADLLGVD